MLTTPRLVAIAVCLATIPPLPAAETEKPRPPNIVFILADDVGQEVLGCYGGTSYRTPHLDSLAAGGIRFQHAYSMPACHPTRVCLLAGRYPMHVGSPRWGSFPEELEKQSLAHVLKNAGYATVVSGKWQLALLKKNPQHPHQLGFDDYCLFGWHEGPRFYRPLIWQNGERRPELAERYGPDVYAEFLIDFMEKNRERPFFAFYSMAYCHAVTNDLKEPVPRGPKGRYDSYKEMAEGMDERVGRIVAALDRLKLRKNTLVLFTTDNGTPERNYISARGTELIDEPIVSMVGDRKVLGGKGSLTDAGTRVPTIASWPGTIAPAQVLDDLIDFSDFLPTFAELAGASLPEGVSLDGQSFAGRLRADTPAPRRWALAEGKSHGGFFVRSQRYKLYRDGQLFDVTADREEKHPLPSGTGTANAEAARRELQLAIDALVESHTSK